MLFWNTWLLRPRVWPGGPALPFTDQIFAPQVTRRAGLVGQALAGRFDVCALAECFEPSEQRTVARAWENGAVQAGPRRGRTRFTSSGLVTVVDPDAGAGASVVGTAAHRFTAGGDLRDSDTYASKGALLVRVRLGGGPEDGTAGPAVDIVSTHLIAGGDWLPVPGANNHRRHHRARMAQVDELVSFVEEHRDRSNPLLLAGDFNVAAHDTHPDFADDPGRPYRELTERLAPLGVEDLWATHGLGAGSTATFDAPDQIPADPGEPDRVADLLDSDPGAAPGQRIDYLWFGPAPTGPENLDRTTATVDRPRRWAFPRPQVRGGPAGSLSDHLALSVTLHLSR